MKKLYISILIVIVPWFLTGQETIQVQLNWYGIDRQKTVKDIEIQTISFENSTNFSQFGALPVFPIVMKLPSLYFGCEFHFDIISADTLSEQASYDLTDADLIQGELIWQVKYNHLDATLYVVPMQKLGERILLIKEFNILPTFIPFEHEELDMQREVLFADKSVLNSGQWFKIGVVKTGIHKISYNDLQQMGVDPSKLDVEKIGVFGNYNGMLPEANDMGFPDDLVENSIYIGGESDGEFNADDYILFYANAPVIWSYNHFSSRFHHENNLYADTVYYFLTTDKGNGKRIQTYPGSTQQPSFTVNGFVDYAAHNNDLENLIYSGKEWFGERFSGDTLERTISFHFPEKVDDIPVYLNFEIVARAFSNSYYQVYANDILVIDSVMITKVSGSGGIYARRSTKSVTFFTEGDQIDIKVKFLNNDVTAIAWLSNIELNVERMLVFKGGQMKFRDPETAASGNISKFEMQDANNVILWDVTDTFNPKNIEYIQLGNDIHFTIATDSLREFIVSETDGFHTPVAFELVANQNLHSIASVDYVIISHPEFLDQAIRLANLHEANEGMNVLVVTPSQIYNEFSSGSQDISAIRNFMRMLYERGAFGEDPGYLLLFGDASFDYKYRMHDNTNFVPTYESKESLRLTSSYVTDDYYGLLDDDEGYDCSGELDIGIGRFPVTDAGQAETAVNKVEHYLSKRKDVMRDWRTQLCFIADDQDNNLHLHQANQLIDIADTLHPGIRINKIFSDAYTKISIPGGKRYPDVNEQITKQVENGAVIINYTGHGGLIGWSEEMILDLSMIHSFSNYDNLPLFITATCEFSRFDDPEFVSAGEYVYLNEHGGGIALLTTTRLAYAHANIVVNRRIYENMNKKINGELPRLGDLVRLSKIPSDNNYLNFVLLGDPALRLAYPHYEVKTTAINYDTLNIEADTIRALQEVNIEGEIHNSFGNLSASFNGFVYPKVYDKPSNYSTQGNDHGSYPEEFQLIDKLLFDGKASVNNGKFSFSFIVPKDIALEYGFGMISYYALDTAQMVDAWGGYEKLVIGGIDGATIPDNVGPIIKLYLEDKTFTTGDATSSNPLLLADLSDNQGISYTGLSLGRDIVMVIDQDYSNSMIMNDYFEIDTDTYKSGSITHQLASLSPGWHTLSLKAWDLHNNSSEAEIEFYIDENANVQLSNVLNYPNPFSNTTKFDFRHNKSNSQLEVEINIFDINGRYITSIVKQVQTIGFNIKPIEWNGEDAQGNKVAPGVYLYHISVTDTYGSTAIQNQKFIKIN